jgi:prepilin-type N-terminal cleavage/methylation domain-containing protein
MKRKGFTLIELMVAMTLLLILVYMCFSAFSVSSAITKVQQEKIETLESVSNILDQLTKELRQTITSTEGHLSFNGILYPASGETRDIASIIAVNSPPPGGGAAYVFDSAKGVILSFYSAEDDGKYLITYTLGIPAGGGVAQNFWADADWQPCELLYSREKWNDINENWTVDSEELVMLVDKQPISEQIISNFGIVRPAWSDKVIQIIIKTRVKDAGGRPTVITRIAQVALRQ